jgi:hypothetical protein
MRMRIAMDIERLVTSCQSCTFAGLQGEMVVGK